MVESGLQLWVGAFLVLWVGLLPGLGSWAHRRVMHWCELAGRRPGRCIAASGLLAATGAAAVSWVFLWPEPSVHDEFSYLLAAETFASGRLTNPTHPFWPLFESFHVFHEPTYMSKYPPAQGLSLAIGLVLAGSAVVSLWLQAAALSCALAWMLFGWLPRRWAALGCLFGTLQFCVSGPWVQTFWGGAVAATGGALVFGAVPRILRRPRTGAAIALACGVAILANSRPFEGLLMCLPVAVALLIFLVRNRTRSDLRIGRRLLLPVGLVLAAAAAFAAYYNWRVTGSPLRMPYSVYDARYARYPPFLFQDLLPMPEFRYPEFRKFTDEFQVGQYEVGRDPLGLLSMVRARAWHLLVFLTKYWMLIPLLALFLKGRRPPVGLALAVGATTVAGLGLTTYYGPHYAAPATACFVLLVTAGWRRLVRIRAWRGLTRIRAWRGRRRIQALSSALLLVLLGSTVFDAAFVSPTVAFGHVRARFRNLLWSKPGRHIVFVQYSDDHSVHVEWVYNAADIDHARIIWARGRDAGMAKALMDHYPEHSVWTLTSGSKDHQLKRLR